MRLNDLFSFCLTLTIMLFISNSTLACPSLNEAVSLTIMASNFLSPDVLWGFFIILLHIVIGIFHTWRREKKPKSKSK